jgi:glycosyltransferase involved in cell wall biosynthesis
MGLLLDIITITKDDLHGVLSTIESTRALRKLNMVRQFIIDGSSEQIRTQVEDAVRQEENVKYVWQQPLGISSAFNLGLELSEADWVWFLNSGDMIHPEVDFATLLSILRTTSADAIIFQIEKKQSHLRHRHPPMAEIWPPVSSWIPHPATIIKRQLFLTHGYFHEGYRIAMDYEMWLRLFSKNVVVDLISMPIAMYDEGGISSTRKNYAAKEILRILLVHALMLLKGWLYTGWMIFRTLGLMIYRIVIRPQNTNTPHE